MLSGIASDMLYGITLAILSIGNIMKKTLSAIAITACLMSLSAHASQSPVMFSTLNGFNAPAANTVGGVRLSVLHGKVNEVKGVDFSFIGLSETDSTVGVNFGLMFGAAKVNQNMTGVSAGILNWMPGETVGVNVGTVNVTGDVKGLNLGVVNFSKGNTLVDFATVSISQQSTVQFGFFNMTENIEGVQIGLLNCADNGFFKCFPFINFSI